MKTLKLLLVCIIIPLLGISQQYYTHTYTIDDGLPSNKVNCLYQDSIGRLWIGTDAGIGIFDGTEFKIINKKDGLASNDVRFITQDNTGNFWFACYDGGLTMYNGKEYTSYTVNDGLYSNFIRRVYYSKPFDILFVGADDGFYTFKDGTFEFYGKANGKLKEKHEILWFLEGDGFVYVFPFRDDLIRFNPITKSIKQRTEVRVDNSMFIGITSAIVTSNYDTVWQGVSVSSKDGIKRFYPDRSGLAFNMCEDDLGNVWIPVFGSVVSGIYRYNGNTLEDYTNKLDLEDVKLNNVLFDKQSGTLWMAAETKGLIAYPKPIFTIYPKENFLKGDHDFRKLHYFNGTKYLVYKDIIVKLYSNGSQNTIPISLFENYKPEQKIMKTFAPNYIWRNTQFNEITADKTNRLWLSTTMGLIQLSKDEKSISRSIIPFLRFRYGKIVFDNQDNLFNWGYWIDTLSIFKQPNIYKTPDMRQFSINDYALPKEITKMLPVDKNMLFSSIYGGLYLYDGTTFSHLNKANPELADNISDMCLDQDKNIIYCTNTGEIGVGSIVQDKFITKYLLDSLDESYGRNFIWVICDTLNNIYVGTNKGMLVVHNPPLYSSRSRDIRFFSSSEGYTDFSVSSPIRDDEGNIWLGSQKSLVQIDVKSIMQSLQLPPKIVLTHLETTDSSYAFAEGISITKNWEFPYSTNNLTFHFNTINLLNPEKDRFSIQLEGFDEAFRDIGSDRKANYTNLPAGKYKFNIRVNNLNSLGKQSQTLFGFTIRPPYWQTWWFYIIISLFLMGILWVVYEARFRIIKKENRAKLEVAELEMQSLQAQMNPHFVFNVLSSLQSYILDKDIHKGITLLGNFSAMIRQTFSLSSKKFITLQEEMNYLGLYLKLEQERFANKFQFQISSDPNLNPSDVMLPSMLLQPMVENAVKHGLSPLEGTDGMLTVMFSKVNERSLKCVIDDNGIGLEKSLAAKQDITTHLSKALSITQRRIELFGRSEKGGSYYVMMTDRSKINPDLTGTRVEIVLPIWLD